MTVALRGTRREPVYTAQRSTDLTLGSPQREVVLSGQFTPVGSRVELDLDVGGLHEAPLGFHSTWELFYGPVGSVLTPVAQADALAAGVSRVKAVGACKGSGHASLVLTGLTPGTPVAYELTCAVVGYAGGNAVADPIRLGVSKLVNWPDSAHYLAASIAGPKLRIIRARHAFALRDEVLGDVTIPTFSNDVAVAPDGSRAATINTDHTITVVTINKETGALAVQGTYTVPGTTPGPNTCGVTPDGTGLWIGNIGTDRLQRMSLVDGTFGTAFNVGADPHRPRVSPDGTLVYVIAGGALQKVTAATGAVAASSPAITGANASSGLALSPDGTRAYVSASTNITEIRTSDMAVLSTVSVGAYGLQHLECFPDGRAIVGGAENNSNLDTIRHFRTNPLRAYVGWRHTAATTNRPVYGLKVTSVGAIYATDFGGDQLATWFGGVVYCHPTNDLMGPGIARLRAKGAR